MCQWSTPGRLTPATSLPSLLMRPSGRSNLSPMVCSVTSGYLTCYLTGVGFTFFFRKLVICFGLLAHRWRVSDSEGFRLEHWVRCWSIVGTRSLIWNSRWWNDRSWEKHDVEDHCVLSHFNTAHEMGRLLPYWEHLSCMLPVGEGFDVQILKVMVQFFWSGVVWVACHK